jgi:hypothetical protein
MAGADRLQRPGRRGCPKDWAAALKRREPILVKIHRSVRLACGQHIVREGTTVQSYSHAPVATDFSIAPRVVIANRHAALAFAEAGGAFRAIPDGEA